jgi:hypothetical protein
VPSLEEHAKRSNALYGDSAEVIHAYIDSAYEVYGGAHRTIRHDTEATPSEVEEIFGEKHKKAKDIATDHVFFDAMESCYKIGIVHDVAGKLCFLKFMKPHFVNIHCTTCENPAIEKFAEIYVWTDWKERLKPRRSRIIPFVSLLFAPKEQDFSDQAERWGTLYYCYKCHQLSLEVLKDADGARILKGDQEFKELMNHALLTAKEALSNAIGHEARISVGAPKNDKGRTENEKEDMYKQAYPELNAEEAELQETQEIDMDFENEEN